MAPNSGEKNYLIFEVHSNLLVKTLRSFAKPQDKKESSTICLRHQPKEAKMTRIYH